MRTIEAGGEEYTVSGNPDMRTVKYVQSMEIEMMRQFIDDEDLLKLEQAEEDDIMDEVLDDADIDDLVDMLWERSTQEALQTVCLGVNDRVTMDEVMDMKAGDFRDLRDEAEDQLGGSATDFINSLEIGIGSTAKIAEAVQEQSNESSDNLPPAVSDLSSGQSEETEATQPTKST